MAHVIFENDGMQGPRTREALTWLEQMPPGLARCSCGALATEVMHTGGSGAAHDVGCFEAFCGEHDHLEGPFERWITTLAPDGDHWHSPWEDLRSTRSHESP